MERNKVGEDADAATSFKFEAHVEAFCFQKETDRQKTTCRHCRTRTETHLRLFGTQCGTFTVQFVVFIVIQLISYRALVCELLGN